MRAWPRIQRFLYSRKNIAGSVLAIFGLGLFFAGVTTGVVGLGVVAALYAIGYLVVPPERGVSVSFDGSQVQDVRQVDGNLLRLLASIRGRVADDIYERCLSIRASIVQTLVQAGGEADAVDPNIFLIRQTALDYLPRALNSYLLVPRLYAEMRPVAGGKTAHDVLLEQLDLMDTKLKEISETVTQHDTEKLLAESRFLQERFAGSSLEVPDGQAVKEREKAEIL